MKYLNAIIPLACALVPTWTLACSFGGLEQDVQFAPASTHLESRQVVALTNWFVEQQNPKRATGGIYRADIYAGAIKDDAASLKKANLRLAEIADLLKTLSTTASVEVQGHIDEFESQAIRHPERLDVLNATVQPACAKTVSCCKWSEGPAASPKQQ
ncbi:hypothetical protein EJP67_09385 [Variovorax guangxiensis]|uniref:OmpA-like domain-containing protein n=1 Tax=Variovorax guangxiensis TaxID=1775474 RepID=A0A3S1EZK9_9BURK|nr:hypothetical protein [Variovorax guangxiensis]RUR67275.1 hypothetical protein EJP67_09385 [Variovorax guangxiensis]